MSSPRWNGGPRAGEPAVGAIDQAVADTLGTLDTTERQHAGRVVRDVLEPRGWRPLPGRKRLRRGQVFTSGAVYGADRPQPTGERNHPPVTNRDDLLARADEACRILAANRRDPDAPVDTVDAFLADRRRMWGEE